MSDTSTAIMLATVTIGTIGQMGTHRPGSDKEGYLYLKSLYYGILPVAQMSANYGGVMIWDRFYDRASNYSSYVKRWA
ncbi:hypothetical protein PR202_gb12915 [Eleusine coracana subsp. coracana]|uniref:Uncharacterized protein n=1 Tax=Eleusine coracana subsp. coracana TaxID=191504 RepID=A0AAV5ESR7_ELECO|nr:hypothetical protein PR202_gb12915 [Eleusine coracana subsp. coracana]